MNYKMHPGAFPQPQFYPHPQQMGQFLYNAPVYPQYYPMYTPQYDYAYAQYPYYMQPQFAQQVPNGYVSMNGTYKPKTKHKYNGNAPKYFPREKTESKTPEKTPEVAEVKTPLETPKSVPTPPSTKAEAPSKPTRPPFFFNLDAKDFNYKTILEARKALTHQSIKHESVKDFPHVIDTSIKVIDYTTDSEFVKASPNILNLKQSNESAESSVNESTTNDLPTTSPRVPSSNWASVLHSSAPKKAVKKQASSLAPTSVASAVPVVRTSDEDPSQPLGITLLKVLFDPLYASLNLFGVIKVRPRGLTNSGNICYMNSILQALLYCEPLNKILKVIEDKTTGNLSAELSTPLLDLTLKFYNDFTSNDGLKPLSPEEFYMSLIKHKKFSHLNWGQQEDAEEFLGYYLDGLHEEFVQAIKDLTTPQVDQLIQNYLSKLDATKYAEFKLQVKNAIKIVRKSQAEKQVEEKEEASADEGDDDGWLEVGASKKVSAKRTVEIEPSPISRIFGGQFRSVLTVPKSKESRSITLDPFQRIQLDISDPSTNTIEDALIKFNEPENIPYIADKKEVIAKKQTFIDQLPNMLVIHLKRFSYQHKDNEDSPKVFGSIEKLRKKIEYSHQLTIPNECFSPLMQKQSPSTKTYKLTGVVYHHGISAEGGHYTCDVLRKSSVFDNDAESSGKSVDNEWIRIDDTAVTFIEKEEVLGTDEPSKSAYILFYQRI